MDKFHEFAFEVFVTLDSKNNKKYDLHPKSAVIQNAATLIANRHNVTPLKHKALNFVKAYFRQMGLMEEVVENGTVFYQFTADGRNLQNAYLTDPINAKKTFMEVIRNAALAMRNKIDANRPKAILAAKVQVNDRLCDTTQNIIITLPTGVVQVKNTEANRNYILQLLLKNI
jgi:hypothetical protein